MSDLFKFELSRIELVISSFLLYQLIVASTLNNLTFLKNHNCLGISSENLLYHKSNFFALLFSCASSFWFNLRNTRYKSILITIVYTNSGMIIDFR